MTYRNSGWKNSPETEDTQKSKTSQTTMLNGFDYSVIPKTVFNLGLVVFLCLTVGMCRVQPETIAQCQKSCSERFSGGSMKKATAYSCTCADRSQSNFSVIKEDPWVLPRN